MDIKAFQDGLAVFKSFLTIFGLALVVVFLFSQGGPLLEILIGRLRGAEIAGVRLEFAEAAIERNVPGELFAHLDDKAKRRIAQDIGGLEPRMVARLLDVGLLADLCEFERPTAVMIDDFGVDLHLRDKGLVRLVDSPRTKAKVIAEVKERQAAAPKKPDIGAPRSCYEMTLTNRGRDVKTAIVQIVSANFGGSPSSEQSGTESLAERRSQFRKK